MATKKKVNKEQDQIEKKITITPSSNNNDFTYEEYYDILMLAKKIRLENEKAIEKAKDPKRKIQLLEELFEQYNISTFAPSSKEKDRLTLLKVNIFIPDSMKFANDYKEQYSKNVRLISEAYQIPAPFVIQKVAEISKYSNYLEQLEKEGGLGEPELFNMGSFKMLYDSNVTSEEMAKINADLWKTKTNIAPKGTDKIVMPSEAKQETTTITQIDTTSTKVSKNENDTPTKALPIEPKQVTPEHTIEQSLPEELPLSDIISSELQQHMHSVEQYCIKLLEERNHTEAQNYTLKKRITVLEEVIKQLQSGKEISVPIVVPTPTISSQTENSLRRQIKDLEFTNSELVTALSEQTKKTEDYKTRAIIAEAQLDQLRDNMFSIQREVDSFGLEGPNLKQ